jgi:uncharacterized protein YkwD
MKARLSGSIVALILALQPVVASAGETAADASAFSWNVLASHNRERARLGLPALRWNARLSQQAREWAVSLANRGAFEHSRKLGDEGENLWTGTAGYYSPDEMIGAFTSQRANFRPGRFPEVSRTGNWRDVGHYAQIIWPSTREVGCALAHGHGWDVLVCRYWPAGNVLGQQVP